MQTQVTQTPLLRTKQSWIGESHPSNCNLSRWWQIHQCYCSRSNQDTNLTPSNQRLSGTGFRWKPALNRSVGRQWCDFGIWERQSQILSLSRRDQRQQHWWRAPTSQNVFGTTPHSTSTSTSPANLLTWNLLLSHLGDISIRRVHQQGVIEVTGWTWRVQNTGWLAKRAVWPGVVLVVVKSINPPVV